MPGRRVSARWRSHAGLGRDGSRSRRPSAAMLRVADGVWRVLGLVLGFLSQMVVAM
jgi:hypothetical protein